jgi:uncharacterized membrane protein
MEKVMLSTFFIASIFLVTGAVPVLEAESSEVIIITIVYHVLDYSSMGVVHDC